jgi:PPOX class probable F420-dependent enzyme
VWKVRTAIPTRIAIAEPFGTPQTAISIICKMRDDVRAVLESAPLVHLVTIDPDGRPQVSLVWVGVDGDEIIVGHQAERRKVQNIRRDDRVALSMLAGSVDPRGLATYLVVHGRATVSEGGAPDVLRPLAKKYLGPDVVFPPGDDPPPGLVTRIKIERVTGIGPWAS